MDLPHFPSNLFVLPQPAVDFVQWQAFYTEYILGLIDMAEKAVRVHVNEDFKDIAKRNGGFPTPLLQAMLLMVGQMYMNREIIGTKTEELPFNYQYLIDLYRNYNK